MSAHLLESPLFKHDLRHIHKLFHHPRHGNIETLQLGALKDLVFA